MSPRPLVRRGRQQTRPTVTPAPASEPVSPPKRAPGRHGTGRAKLDDDDVRAIRADYAAGRWGRVDLAYIYGVTPCTIGNVVKRISYTHVKSTPEQQEF